MANNRLYLFDPSDGGRILLAKSFGNGWEIRCTAERLQEWMDARDVGASYGCGNEIGRTVLALEADHDHDESKEVR